MSDRRYIFTGTKGRMEALINILCLVVPYFLLSHQKIKFLQGHMFRKLMLSVTASYLLGSFFAKFFSVSWVIHHRHYYEASEFVYIALQIALLPFVVFLLTFIPNPFRRKKKKEESNV